MLGLVSTTRLRRNSTSVSSFLGCHGSFAVKVYQKSVGFVALAWLVNVMVDYVYSISG